MDTVFMSAGIQTLRKKFYGKEESGCLEEPFPKRNKHGKRKEWHRYDLS